MANSVMGDENNQNPDLNGEEGVSSIEPGAIDLSDIEPADEPVAADNEAQNPEVPVTGEVPAQEAQTEAGVSVGEDATAESASEEVSAAQEGPVSVAEPEVAEAPVSQSEAPEQAPAETSEQVAENPPIEKAGFFHGKKGLILKIAIGVVVLGILGGVGWWFASADEAPPELEAGVKGGQGFMSKDVEIGGSIESASFLSFSPSDVDAFKKLVEARDGDVTTAMNAAGYVYLEKDSTFEEILRLIDPSEQPAVILAMWQPDKESWLITENSLYTKNTDQIAIADLAKAKVPAGRGVALITSSPVKAFDLKNETHKPSDDYAQYDVCSEHSKGWYLFAADEVSSVNACEDAVKSVWKYDLELEAKLAENPDPNKSPWVKFDGPTEAALAQGEYGSMVWINFKSSPVESLQAAGGSGNTNTGGDNNDNSNTEEGADQTEDDQTGAQQGNGEQDSTDTMPSYDTIKLDVVSGETLEAVFVNDNGVEVTVSEVAEVGEDAVPVLDPTFVTYTFQDQEFDLTLTYEGDDEKGEIVAGCVEGKSDPCFEVSEDGENLVIQNIADGTYIFRATLTEKDGETVLVVMESEKIVVGEVEEEINENEEDTTDEETTLRAESSQDGEAEDSGSTFVGTTKVGAFGEVETEEDVRLPVGRVAPDSEEDEEQSIEQPNAMVQPEEGEEVAPVSRVGSEEEVEVEDSIDIKNFQVVDYVESPGYKVLLSFDWDGEEPPTDLVWDIFIGDGEGKEFVKLTGVTDEVGSGVEFLNECPDGIVAKACLLAPHPAVVYKSEIVDGVNRYLYKLEISDDQGEVLLEEVVKLFFEYPYAE